MGRYEVGDYVKTRYGLRRITKVWALNNKITVFETIDVNGNKKELFYGDIIKIIAKGDK